MRLAGVDKNLVIILAQAERVFLLADSQLDFSKDFTTHTHTHSQGSSVLASYKTETDPLEKSASYNVRGADQQTSIVTNRELIL